LLVRKFGRIIAHPKQGACNGRKKEN